MKPHGGNSFIPWNGFSSCNVRFRAVDNAGNVSAWSSGVHIHQDTEAPTFVNWWFGTVNSDIIQLYVQATDNVGISKIQLPTSTEKGGGVDWVWIDAVWDASANAYRADIYPSTWGHYNTTYYTHLYIYDYAGNGGYYGNTAATIGAKTWTEYISRWGSTSYTNNTSSTVTLQVTIYNDPSYSTESSYCCIYSNDGVSVVPGVTKTYTFTVLPGKSISPIYAEANAAAYVTYTVL